MERKRLLLVLLGLGVMSLQTRTKLQQTLNGVLDSCKLKFAFIKRSFPILSDYQKILYLELFINFSVVSAISPLMATVSDT